jgi:hypothetical protein
MVMNNFKNIVYTHSEYFDVLDIFLEQQKKFGIEDYTIFSDTIFQEASASSSSFILYEDHETYSNRLKNCLLQLESDIILYQHEDMFLYKEPDIDILNRYVDYLRGSEYSFLRLCKTGNCKLSFANINLYEIDPKSPDFFAVQPTLWKTKDFLRFLDCAGEKSIWDLELYSNQIKHNIKGLMHYQNEEPRGGHFNSNVWPYVATAIVKGNWNFMEYPVELSRIEKVKGSERGKFL